MFTQYKTEFYIDIYLFKHKKDLVRVKATKLDIWKIRVKLVVYAQY